MPRTDPELAVNFIASVWRSQPKRGHAFLAWKDVDRDVDFDERVFHDKAYHSRNHGLGTDDEPLPVRRDLYFCPNTFDDEYRRKTNANSGRWLYADLDEIDPRELDDEVRPTIAWQTSPGRYQCMWRLTKPLRPSRLAALNQRMTYYTGADRNGWSLTKVLRVPGTLNCKREKPVLVRLLWNDGPSYTPQSLLRLTRGLVETQGLTSDLSVPDTDSIVLGRVWRRLRRKDALAAAKAKQLSLSDVEPGRRSEVLWKLENMLYDLGAAPEEILAICLTVKWNKYAQRLPRGKRQNWSEISKLLALREREEQAKKKLATSKTEPERKARKRKTKSKAKQPKMLQTVPLSRFMAIQHAAPHWLVEGIWSRGAYGVWAGEFKAFKTVTLLDLAISVASGQPFLGRFTVPRESRGRVLYLHEEGRPGFIQDRIQRVMAHKGLAPTVNAEGDITNWGTSIPVDISSFVKFNLSNDSSFEQLHSYILQRRPKLVILEAWYLISGEIGEKDDERVAPVLARLAELALKYKFALIISHHFHKKREGDSTGRAAERISGTGVFSRWWESAVLIERKGEEDDFRIAFEAMHREQVGTGKVGVTFQMDPQDENSYSVEFVDDIIDIEVADFVVNGFDLRTLRKAVWATELRQKMKLKSAAEVYDITDSLGLTRKRESKLVNGKSQIRWKIYPPESRSAAERAEPEAKAGKKRT